jgi:hypothetical protein
VSYLQNISRLKGNANLGGLVEIRVARKADVTDIPLPIGGMITGDITFPEGKGFVTWLVTQESLSLKSNSRDSREGISKTNRLPFRVPLDQYNVRMMMEQAEEDEFIVLVKYPNGTYKLFGTLDGPVKFSFDHDSGTSHADGNFNNCEFYYDGPQNIFFYQGAIPAPIPGTGTSRVEYLSGDLIALLSPSDVLTLTSDFHHAFTLIPGLGGISAPAVVKWSDGEVIATMQPGDILRADTDFTDDFEIFITT